MSDYQQIPGSIRSFLATNARTWTEHTSDLATLYAMLCDETNQRLRRCADYLRRGMGSAALHLAECQPNLADAVGSLQFPERSVWADICVTHGMPAPPVLEAECLDALKAAAEREKSLQPLLSRHRLLAIAKAPTAARLEVARLLAKEDAANPAWVDEIASLESVRLNEIAHQAHLAVQADDEQAIASLWEELSDPRWRHDIPADIHDSLRDAVNARKARKAEGELTEVAAEIVSAMAAKAPAEQIDGLIAQWKQLATKPGVHVPPELAALVEPALARQAEVSRRRQELEDVRPLQQLAASQSQAEPSQAGRNIPVVATAVTAVGLVAGAIGYYCVHYLRK